MNRKAIISRTQLDELGNDHNLNGFGRIDSLPNGKGILLSSYKGMTKADNGTIIHLRPEIRETDPIDQKRIYTKILKNGAYSIYSRQHIKGT